MVLFEEFWKQREKTLSYIFGTMDFENIENQRPEFRPSEVRYDPLTGKDKDYYPPLRRLITSALGMIPVLTCAGVVIAITVQLMLYKTLINNTLGNLPVASVANTISIIVFDQVYKRLAVFLIDLENHETQTAYDDSLITKSFIFR